MFLPDLCLFIMRLHESRDVSHYVSSHAFVFSSCSCTLATSGKTVCSHAYVVALSLSLSLSGVVMPFASFSNFPFADLVPPRVVGSMSFLRNMTSTSWRKCRNASATNCERLTGFDAVACWDHTWPKALDIQNVFKDFDFFGSPGCLWTSDVSTSFLARVLRCC